MHSGLQASSTARQKDVGRPGIDVLAAPATALLADVLNYLPGLWDDRMTSSVRGHPHDGQGRMPVLNKRLWRGRFL